MKKTITLLLITIILATLTSCTVETNTTQKQLPTIDSLQKLQKLVQQQQYKRYGLEIGNAQPETATDEAQRAPVSPDYSDTNVQVDGIDEGDIIKTDGQYLYQISENNIIITKIYPVEEAKVISKTKLDDDILPVELYLQGDKIVVLSYKNNYSNEPNKEIGIPGFFYYNNTIIQVYNNKDGKLTKERELETEGSIVSTRKKDSYLYLVTSKYLGYLDQPEGNPAPMYRDTAKDKEKYQQKPLTDIQYFPDGELSSFVNIVALDIKKPKEEAKVETYLGSAQNIYMSHENLYIALTTVNETHVHKFSVDGIKVKYTGQGKVKGHVLNQFSMDEYKGNFRIATTQYDREEMTNNLYILDKNLETIGKLENLAPTERIYSARFMGDKGYMVTFELVDPLFVIDLSNPRAPKVLGELKIPGFSNYLHPIDENHLLGIGRDTTVATSWGREVAIELGVKLAIFDVSDVNNPKEKHVEIIGGRGTYSEALHNHRSIHYHNDVLSFPITVTDPSNNRIDQYGLPKFIGAYVYNVDKEKGFDLAATITHMTNQQMERYYDHGNYKDHIRRIITVDEHIYTISDQTIQVHNKDCQLIKEIKLK